MTTEPTDPVSTLEKEIEDAVKHLSFRDNIHVYKRLSDIPEHFHQYLWDCETGQVADLASEDEPHGVPFRFWIKHPFMNQPIPLMLPACIETVISMRVAAGREALNQKNWGSYLGRIERPWRMTTLLELARSGEFDGGVRDQIKFWSLLSDVWVDAEADEADPIWGDILAVDIPHRDRMTTRRDRDRLVKMAPSPCDTITIYKGVQHPVRTPHHLIPQHAIENGYSWTLSIKTAKFFAGRLVERGHAGHVVRAQVARRDVIAYLTNRGEEEIIVKPGNATKGERHRT